MEITHGTVQERELDDLLAEIDTAEDVRPVSVVVPDIQAQAQYPRMV